MFNITMKALKDDIDRAFRVLGADKGFGQNVTDILHWRDEGFLTDEQYKELRRYNRTQYHELTLDM